MYKHLRFYFRLILAFCTKYLFLIVLGMVLAGFTSVILPHLLTYIPKSHVVRRIGIIGKYSASDLPSSVLNKISFGLTVLDKSGLPLPGLAQSWQISSDGKEYQFTLSPKIFWQNGLPIKSRDIRYEFRDAEITYPSDKIIDIKLKEPFSPLPVLLAKPILKVINSKFLTGIHFVGIGSYKISGFTANGQDLTSMDLQPVSLNSGSVYYKYYFYLTSQQAKTAFKLGLLDEIEEIPSVGDLNVWPNSRIQTQVLNNRYVGVFFNTQDPDLTGQSGKNLRIALAYAIDKYRWPNRAIGPISPSSWAYNSDVKRYDYDLNKALDLIKKVDKVPKTIKLSTVPAYSDIAEGIKKDWEKLNIQTDISISPDIPDNFQILIVAQAVPPDPDQYNFWHSTQGSTNLTRLNNPRIDKLLEDGRKTYDINLRKSIYLDFQKYLVEEVPAVFLFYPESYSVTKK